MGPLPRRAPALHPAHGEMSLPIVTVSNRAKINERVLRPSLVSSQKRQNTVAAKSLRGERLARCRRCSDAQRSAALKIFIGAIQTPRRHRI